MRTTLVFGLLFVSACVARPNYKDDYQHHPHHYNHHRHNRNGRGSESSVALSPWAQTHMNDVKSMADRMRQEFNAQSHGRYGAVSSSSPSRTTGASSNLNIPSFTGKSQEELDQLAKQITEQMIADMKSGRLTYTQISQPNWFEKQAAKQLEALDHEDSRAIQQRAQNVFEFEPQVREDSFGTELESLSNFDEFSHVTYPPSIAIIGGKRYVTQKNCTTVTTAGNGNENLPPYTSGSNYQNHVHKEKITNYPGQVIIPVEDNEYERESRSSDVQQRTIYPDFNFTDNMPNSGFGVGNQVVVHSPGGQAKITISHLNRTITSGPGYQYPVVSGCRGTTVIVNGNVVYNHSQAIGTGSTSCSSGSYEEAEWKRKEREHLFWLLAQRSIISEEALRRWQEMNWQRLTELAQEYRTTVEEIKEFQRNELKNYFEVVNKYGATSEYYDNWMKLEKARWDWLIQQNRITQEELARWQQLNRERLDSLANLYSISIEELQNWQRNELQRFQNILSEQNVKIARLTEWQAEVRNRLNTLMLQHNTTVEQLRENIRQDLSRLQSMSQVYHVDTEEFKRWLENEQQRITRIIEQRPMLVIENWQRDERQRLEQVIRQFNLSADELRERLEVEHTHLMDLANQYHVNVEKIKEWQRQEIIRLQNEGRLQQARLEEWQRQLQDQLKSIIRQHEVTVTELEELIKRDHQRLQDLAQQHQISIWKIENWYKGEAERLVNALRVENLERDWKWRERQRIDEFLRRNEYTVEELKQNLLHDRRFLEDMARTYQLQIQELENWYESEIKRLQELGLLRFRVENLVDWQRQEDSRIQDMIQNRNFTIEDLRYRLTHDYDHLLQLNQQHSVSQQQILQWYNEEIDYLLKNNLLHQAESLKDWQIKETEYINELIKNHTFTVEDLTRRLEYDRQHLESLTKQYNVQVTEILEWYRKEAESLANRGIIREMEMLQEWQKAQRQYIYELIRNHETTINDLKQRLINDQNYLNRLSQELHVSVYELEEWYRKEIERLINQGFIHQTESIQTWQQLETERILNIIKEQNVNFEQLQQILINNQQNLYDLARKYQINIQELESWYRSELFRLREEGTLQNITQWQMTVRNRLEELIKDHRYSIEELKDRLNRNEDYLYQLIHQYNITMEQLIDWYNKELQRLYEQDLIYTSKLWQEQERVHLESLAAQYQQSLKKLEEMLLRNEALLKEIAEKYHITVKQLLDWYHKLINEFLSRGVIINDLVSAEADWKEKERERLHYILLHTRMSYSEFDDFLRDDVNYNQLLANGYNVNFNVLREFQVNELRELLENERLKKLNLIVLQDWEKQERDQLYDLIRQHGITREKLPMWQKTNHGLLEQKADRYGISTQALIDWQRNELQRLYELAVHYNMTFYGLEKFRSYEVLRIANIAHRPTLHNEYQNWEINEQIRLENLRKQLNSTDEQLWHWRRRLYLYCQGLLHLPRDCNYVTRMGQIDERRGDQPPNHVNECDEDNEPGIVDPTYIPVPPVPQGPTRAPYVSPLAPLVSPVRTSIYKYEQNKTQKVIIGPNAHSTGYEHFREYKEESGKSTGSSGWSSYDSSRSHQNGYGNRQNYYSHNAPTFSQDSTDVQRQHSMIGPYSSGVALHEDDTKEFQSDQQKAEDLTQQFEDFGQQVEDIRGELENLEQQTVQHPSQKEIGKLIGSQTTKSPKQAIHTYSSTLRNSERQRNSPPKEIEDMVQQFEDDGQQIEDIRSELEGLGQQRVQRPSQKEIEKLTEPRNTYPLNQRTTYLNRSPKEKEDSTAQRIYPGHTVADYSLESDNMGQQVIQQVQYPSASEIEELNQRRRYQYPSAGRTGYSSSSSDHRYEQEHHAKIEEINPNLEVEAVQVTEKPGLWKRIFG